MDDCGGGPGGGGGGGRVEDKRRPPIPVAPPPPPPLILRPPPNTTGPFPAAGPPPPPLIHAARYVVPPLASSGLPPLPRRLGLANASSNDISGAVVGECGGDRGASETLPLRVLPPTVAPPPVVALS
jgi:hypothetical protein